VSTTNAAAIPDGPPYVGALLRMCLQIVRSRMQEAAREAGFTDLQDAHWAMITYPVASGVRPSELARRARISRQAANHQISQLESLGYFERRSPDGAARRLVFLTPRGEALAATIHACLREVHAEWAREVGAERFATLLDVLRVLSRPEDPAAPAR
jgi:DNA-binding MarR family transcriptional regulator